MLEVILLAAALTAAGQPPVATVNGVALAAWEADREYVALVGSTRFHRSIEPARERELRREALDTLVLKELKRQWAAQEGVSAAAGEATAAWRRVRERFPDEAAYLRALEEKGIEEAAFRAAFARDAVAQATDRRILSQVAPPTPQASRDYFAAHRDEYRVPEARHIVHLLVHVPPGADGVAARRAEEEADRIAAAARAGDLDLTAEVQRRLDALPPRYRDRVGDLGFVHRGALTREVEPEVFAAPSGAVVGPVRSLYGFHVVQVLGARPSQPLAFAEVQDAVAARLLRERRTQALTDFEHRLRNRARVTESSWADGP